MPYNKEFFDVQSYVEFTKAQTLQELTSTENIAVSLGKIARYYNNLVRSDLDIRVNGTLKNYYRPLNTSDNQIDFRAGTNISLTYDDTNNSITINSAASGSSVSYTPIISSGTAIGTLTIDGVDNTLYYTQYTHDTVTPLTAYGPSYVTYNSTGHITGSSYNIHSARGTNGSAGWVKVANILIRGTFLNEPIKLTISQRTGTGLIYDLNIKFSNAETDPVLTRFISFSDMADADNGNDAYIIKTDTNTWDLYIKKLDAYDIISVNEFDIGQYSLGRITWTWTDVHASTLPSGGTYVTKKTYLTEETVGYKAITQHSEIDGSTGSFVFSGTNAIFNDSGADYVGLQVGYSGDEFQLIGSGNSDDNNSLFIRRNDTPNDSTGWSDWSRLLTPASVKAINNTNPVSVTVNEVTKGDYTIASGVTIGHKTMSVDGTISAKTLTYGGTFGAIEALKEDGYGHISEMTITTYTMPELKHISITKSTDTTSTASPGYGGTFTAVDSITRDTYGHVTKINTKTITLPDERKVAMLGSDTAGSSGWYKVVDGSLTGYANSVLTFFVQTPASGASGILYLDIRCDSSVLTLRKFGWLVHEGYNTGHFIFNIDGTSWSVYQYIARNQYYRDFWTVMAESGTNTRNASYTLYNSKSPESTSPVTSNSNYSEDYNDAFPYTATNPSNATTYGITFNAGTGGTTGDPSTRKNLRTNDGIKYYTREGTTSAVGYGYIVLGNEISSGTAGNKCGAVRCYTTTDAYVQLSGAKDSSSMRFSHSSGTAGSFSPSTDNIYDLGTSTERWKNIYASGSISGSVGTFSSALTVNGTASVNGINLYNPTTQMYVNLIAPSNLNSAPNITFPKSSGTVALTSDIPKYTAGDTYTPIYFNSSGTPTKISVLNDDGGWLVYNGGSEGVDARLVTNRTIGHWNGRVGSTSGASNLCYFGCANLDTGFAGDLNSVGGAIFSTNSYFSNSTQKFTGIQIGDTREEYRKMQLVTAGGSSGRIYARYSTAKSPGATEWSNPVSLLQSGDIRKGAGINITPSQITFGDAIIQTGYTIDLDFKVSTSGSGNVVTGISFLDDTLTVTKGSIQPGSTVSLSNASTTGSSVATITINGTATNLKAPHINITTSTDTTSTASPGYGGTFTAVDSVTRDTYGHVTKINTKTIEMPANPHNAVTALTEYGPSYVTYDDTGHITGSSYNVHSAVGTNGSSGWVKIANILIRGTYANEPIKLTISQRTGSGLIYDLDIKFNNASTDPTLTRFMAFSNITDGIDAYMVRTATNTWDLYIKKLDPYDHISINEFDVGRYLIGRITWTWTDVHADTLPEGGTYVTKNTYAYTSDVPTISASYKYALGVNIGSVTIDGTETIYIVPKGTSSQTGVVTVSDSYSSSGGSASSSVAASSYAVNQVYQIASDKSSVSVGTDSYLKTTTLTVDGSTTKLCHSTPCLFQRIGSVNAAYWRKVIAVAFTGANTNQSATFLMHETFGHATHKPQVGILAVNCRSGGTAGTVTRSNCFMEWLVASSTISVNDFALLYYNGEDINGNSSSSSVRFEIWVKGKANYATYQISMLEAVGGTAGDTKESWRMYTVTTTGSSGQSSLPSASGDPIYSTKMAILS